MRIQSYPDLGLDDVPAVPRVLVQQKRSATDILVVCTFFLIEKGMSARLPTCLPTPACPPFVLPWKYLMHMIRSYLYVRICVMQSASLHGRLLPATLAHMEMVEQNDANEADICP